MFDKTLYTILSLLNSHYSINILLTFGGNGYGRRPSNPRPWKRKKKEDRESSGVITTNDKFDDTNQTTIIRIV